MAVSKRERAVIIVTKSVLDRFYKKTITSSTGCILWTGATSPNGYGQVKLSDGTQSAHVVAWRMAHEGVNAPSGNLVMHMCDVKLCVNPDHLEIGTTSQNMKDAYTKGRGNHTMRHGEECQNSKLSDHSVNEILQHKASGIGYRKISRLLGLPMTAVREAYYGNTWKHCITGN